MFKINNLGVFLMNENLEKIEEMSKENERLDNYMVVKLKSISENEKVARNIIAAFLLEKNPSVEELSDIKTAISEAVTNCVVHGYSELGGEIIISAKLKKNCFYVKVEDFGVGISDISRAMQPFYTTGKEGERSGMGFTVMETFMDSIRVYNQVGKSGLVVEMIKEISSSEN